MSPPPHPPRPPSPGVDSTALTKEAGHVNQVHDVHLFGNPLISLFVAQCSKVDVQIT
jgi:hypothetical protein